MLKFIEGVIIAVGVIVIIIKVIPMIRDASKMKKDAEEAKRQVSERVLRMSKDLENMSMSYKCQNCGSSMTIDPKHISSFCPFCGAALPKAEELIQKAYEYAEKDEERKFELEKLNHAERESIRVNKIIILMFIPLFILIGLMCYVIIK